MSLLLITIEEKDFSHARNHITEAVQDNIAVVDARRICWIVKSILSAKHSENCLCLAHLLSFECQDWKATEFSRCSSSLAMCPHFLIDCNVVEFNISFVKQESDRVCSSKWTEVL